MLYRVKTNIKKDGVHYAPGSEIELDDATAKRIAHAVEGPILAPVKVSEPVANEPIPAEKATPVSAPVILEMDSETKVIGKKPFTKR